MLSTIAVAAALAFAACGSDEDDAGSSRSKAAGNGTDRAFVAAMIPHHESAVDMAEIATKRGESEFVRKLADDVISTQNAEISTMRREDEVLDTAGVKLGSLDVPDHMTGMDDDPAELRKAKPFDRAFIEMMIPHHEGAVTMAKAELDKGEDPELKALAEDIISAQEREINEMREHLGGAPADHGEAPHDEGGGHSD
jgi:uncharacterized protein (DUF305 family)